MQRVALHLFITGTTNISDQVVTTLREMCEDVFSGFYNLEIIDVLKEPHRAEADRIMATPTLLKTEPLPVRRIVGDMTNKAKVLQALALSGSSPGPYPENIE